MNYDYGRVALEKYSELEQRIRQMERASVLNRCKTLVFEGKFTGVSDAEQSSDFCAICDGDVAFKVSADFSQSVSGTLTIFIDGEKYRQSTFSSTHVVTAIHDVITSGVCSILVKIESQTQFNAEVYCEVTGNVEYIEKDCRLDVFNSTDYSAVLYREDGVVKLNRYAGGVLTLKEVITASKASVCGYSGGFFLSQISADRTLSAVFYTHAFEQSFRVDIDSKVSDCFAVNEEYPTVYYIKNNMLKKCVITSESTKTYSDCNVCAKSAVGLYSGGKTYIALEDKNGLKRLYVL